jgi:hypothetical protein
MAHVPKYEKVKASILADIRSGFYKTGERIPTREELIAKYSVTRTTVNQALKILVNAGVLSTSKRGGTVVTGQPMPLDVAFVSSLGGVSPGDIVRISENENTVMFRPLLEVMSEFNVDFINIRNVSESDFDWTEKYDCVVWVMPDDRILSKLPKYKDKMLVINRYHKDLNFIATNHRKAVCEMTKYNLERSGENKQIFFLNSTVHDEFIWRERREGFVDACQSKDLFYRICNLNVDNYESILKSLMAIEFEPDKNIVMVSPCLAYSGAVLQMVQRRGLVFDENFFYSDFDNRHSQLNTGVKIVSAIQDYEHMGHEIVKALRNFGKEKIQIFVPAEIIK